MRAFGMTTVGSQRREGKGQRRMARAEGRVGEEQVNLWWRRRYRLKCELANGGTDSCHGILAFQGSTSSYFNQPFRTSMFPPSRGSSLCDFD
jgi:hypothetical protein